MENKIKDILKEIGEDPNRIGLKDTPGRIVKMYKEIFRGYNKDERPKLTVFPNGEDGIMQDQMIIDKGYFYSYCEHHMVPFFGEYYFAYIPVNKIIGISKVSRLVDWYAAKLQVQERLTQQIVDDFQKVLEPLGIMLVMKARHLCKEMRGVRKHNTPMITSCVTGVFKYNLETRDEFLRLINLK